MATKKTDDDIINDAINAACLSIQQDLGVTTGDLAAAYFSGENLSEFESLLLRYLIAEQADQRRIEEEDVRLFREEGLTIENEELVGAFARAGVDVDVEHTGGGCMNVCVPVVPGVIVMLPAGGWSHDEASYSLMAWGYGDDLAFRFFEPRSPNTPATADQVAANVLAYIADKRQFAQAEVERLVAKEFATLLSDGMKREEWQTMLARNAAETNPNICHSHDFLDANVVMAQAFESFNISIDPEREADGQMWGRVWDLAKPMLRTAKVVCPGGVPECTNDDSGGCPGCYAETGNGCPHGEPCGSCRNIDYRLGPGRVIMRRCYEEDIEEPILTLERFEDEKRGYTLMPAQADHVAHEIVASATHAPRLLSAVRDLLAALDPGKPEEVLRAVERARRLADAAAAAIYPAP